MQADEYLFNTFSVNSKACNAAYNLNRANGICLTMVKAVLQPPIYKPLTGCPGHATLQEKQTYLQKSGICVLTGQFPFTRFVLRYRWLYELLSQTKFIWMTPIVTASAPLASRLAMRRGSTQSAAFEQRCTPISAAVGFE